MNQQILRAAIRNAEQETRAHRAAMLPFDRLRTKREQTWTAALFWVVALAGPVAVAYALLERLFS